MCAVNINRFLRYRRSNQSSLSALLISFFEKFSNIDVRAAYNNAFFYFRIGLTLPSNNKGSRKRILGPTDISCDGKKRKMKKCKTCNMFGYHDSHTCPEKGNVSEYIKSGHATSTFG